MNDFVVHGLIPDVKQVDRLCELAEESVKRARKATWQRFFESCKTAVLVRNHEGGLMVIVVSSSPELGRRWINDKNHDSGQDDFIDISEDMTVKRMIATNLFNGHENSKLPGVVDVYLDHKLTEILESINQL